MPKVSVLVPLFNTDPIFLKEMVESVLDQTLKDFELILLNDSPSNYDLDKIINEYKDSRIKFFRNDKNIGISESRNKLIKLAKSEYIAILDHDDVCYPRRLELEAKILDENPEIGVCSSWTYEIPEGKLKKEPETNIEIKTKLLNKCCVSHSASMIRKSILIENQIEYEKIFSPCEDYMLWIKLMAVTGFYNIQEPLLKYRNSKKNTSHKQKNKMKERSCMVKCLAYKNYSYLLPENSEKYWIKFFCQIPLIKVKRKIQSKVYYLFGFIPIISINA